MNDDRRDAFTFKDALQMRNHPGERRQRAKRRLFVRDIVAGGAEQPAAAGINECRLVRLRRKMRQQAVKQATVDVDHVATEVACQMDDCIQGRKRW